MREDLQQFLEEENRDIEKLRDKFDELFPKDIEATMGIRPSKSNRSAALVLWAEFQIMLRARDTRLLQKIHDIGEGMKREVPLGLTPEEYEEISAYNSVFNHAISTYQSLINPKK